MNAQWFASGSSARRPGSPAQDDSMRAAPSNPSVRNSSSSGRSRSAGFGVQVEIALQVHHRADPAVGTLVAGA
ncbi:hypothetical protein ABZY36_08075 [Streptomyces sp. NPDC006627]|uniref:hypothetical protein n=1 Tax=Streptomyces sp. NPDC006627 TaxID=3154679 RepID=UPI0033B5D328